MLSEVNIKANAYVDEWAKKGASEQCLRPWQTRAMERSYDELVEIATWIGTVCVLANHFPDNHGTNGAKVVFLRDSDAVAVKRKKQVVSKRKRSPQVVRPCGDLSKCPRWCAVRDRIRNRGAG